MNAMTIGKNAGLVWHALHDSESRMTFQELMKKTGLSEIDLANAIGWLAREDKLLFVESGSQTFYSVYHESYY